MHDPVFYLSSDKLFLMDIKGRNIYSMVAEEGRTYYKPITIESEAYEKICTNSTSVKVCSVWGDAYQCLEFENVDICSEWKLLPTGYANVS